MEERKCFECGEPLRGRADQKFCNDLCRNAYNNKKLGKSSKYIRKINRILRTNHSILKDLNTENKTTIPSKKLEKENFNFNYHTHYYKTRNGKVYFFCYDQGYLKLDSNRYLLVKKEDI
ncbi:hypothetical protein [Maribellus maritimus]|uniref:hypothetical protein n=1 Tax=Maribellus maritimus TaxID=2870838 RepID=UPI001EEC6656|nr:hypothetical protein [Maribellus maritimus]MCG6189276.1 hypothetical protein [Maribellus maritimus]